MKASKLSDWLQILALIGVLAGLLLVAYEIRQNTDFARAQYNQASYGNWMQISATELETDIGPIFIRSIDDPDSLTKSDMFKLNAWLTFVVSIFDHSDRAYDLGIASQIALVDVGEAQFYFSSEFSRAWFEANKGWMRPRVVDSITHAIESTPVSKSWDPRVILPYGVLSDEIQ